MQDPIDAIAQLSPSEVKVELLRYVLALHHVVNQPVKTNAAVTQYLGGMVTSIANIVLEDETLGAPAHLDPNLS